MPNEFKTTFPGSCKAIETPLCSVVTRDVLDLNKVFVFLLFLITITWLLEARDHSHSQNIQYLVPDI